MEEGPSALLLILRGDPEALVMGEDASCGREERHQAGPPRDGRRYVITNPAMPPAYRP